MPTPMRHRSGSDGSNALPHLRCDDCARGVEVLAERQRADGTTEQTLLLPSGITTKRLAVPLGPGQPARFSVKCIDCGDLAPADVVEALWWRTVQERIALSQMSSDRATPAVHEENTNQDVP